LQRGFFKRPIDADSTDIHDPILQTHFGVNYGDVLGKVKVLRISADVGVNYAKKGLKKFRLSCKIFEPLGFRSRIQQLSS
jgi:hypothetical protein